MPAEGGGDEQIVLPPFLSSPLPQSSVSSSCIDQPSHPSPSHSLDPSRYSIKQLRSSEGGGGRRRRWRWRWTSVEKVTVALCDSEDSSAISTLATCLVNKLRRKLLSSSSAQSQTVMGGFRCCWQTFLSFLCIAASLLVLPLIPEPFLSRSVVHSHPLPQTTQHPSPCLIPQLLRKQRNFPPYVIRFVKLPSRSSSGDGASDQAVVEEVQGDPDG